MSEHIALKAAGVCTAEPLGHFCRPSFREGVRIMTRGGLHKAELYVPPKWNQSRTILGRYGPDEGWHLAECCPEADAIVLAGLVPASRLRFMLNTVNTRCIGVPTVADIEAVRGIAVRLPLRSSAQGDDTQADTENRRVLNEAILRLSDAKAEPTYFFGYSPTECWVVWLLDSPDPVRGDAKRRREFDALTFDLAEAVGGKAAAAPLLTDLPLPGACNTRTLAGGVASIATNTALDLRMGRDLASYGTRFGDLETVRDRIRATPAVSIAA